MRFVNSLGSIKYSDYLNWTWACCLILLCSLATTSPACAQDEAAENAPEYPRPGKLPLPGNLLDVKGAEWLNTSEELSLDKLKGKIVLFDFWTYCCINCMHVLPDLEYLEKKYPNELVVIGVHSAKFDNEKVTDNIRNAIVRYEISHPVLNDSEMIIWRKLGIRSWPSLLLIDAENNACLLASGEGNREVLDQTIGKLIAYHKATDTLDDSPFNFKLERDKIPPTPLKYPGKLLADEPNNRLFVSDSNNNRIVISSLDGKLIDTIGTGQEGADDGDYKSASFDHPQGMTLIDDTLYVADTENHLIRTVDLKSKTVSTLIGTGEQSRFRSNGGNIKTAAINSPWALAHHDGILYIAMAGPHQLWKHDLGSQNVEVYAGSGREDIIDGPLPKSALAQPSSLILKDDKLYVADSEGSSIREVPTDPTGEITTIVGTHDLGRGRSLFEFGDIDGTGQEARLQHPLGLIFQGDTLYIADTYNHKIKTAIPTKNADNPERLTQTFLGTGKSGSSLDPLELSEPSGLAVVGNRLLIADTNNHRIVSYDLKTKKASEFIIEGLQPPSK